MIDEHELIKPIKRPQELLLEEVSELREAIGRQTDEIAKGTKLAFNH